MRRIRQFAFSVCFAAIVSVAPFAHADDIEKAMEALTQGDSSTALAMLRPIAKEGNEEVQLILSLIYIRGDGVEQNYEEGVKWLRKSAELGFAPAQYNLAGMYIRGEWVERNYDRAIEWYRKSAEQGFVVSQVSLAEFYLTDIEPNYEQAAKWLGRAIREDNIEKSVGFYEVVDGLSLIEHAVAHGQGKLAIMHANGLGFPQNHEEAVRLINELGKRDIELAKEYFFRAYPAAHTVMNVAHRVAKSRLGDDAQTIIDERKYLDAAEQGDVDAQLFLAAKYDDDLFSTSDEKYAPKAAKWARLAAEQGNPDAQNMLAVYYHFGQGVPQDRKRALEWNRKAAEQGQIFSMLNLSSVHEYGIGAEWDREKAMEWRRKALKAKPDGQYAALHHMVEYYSDGLSTEKDFISAYVWNRIAYKDAFDKISSNPRMVVIKSRLSADQIAEADRLADKCVESGYEACPYHIKLPGLRGVNG